MTRIAFVVARDRQDLMEVGDLRRLAFQEVSIIHGPAPQDARSPGLVSLQAFASTVEALHVRETVLPLRFGSLHETEGDLEAVLRFRLDEWRERLDEVEGCVEMGLRVLLNTPLPTPGRVEGASSRPAWNPNDSQPGLAYLATRRIEMARRDALQGEAARVESAIAEALQGLHRRRVIERPGSGRETLLSLAFLVPRVDLEAFRGTTLGLHDRGLGKLMPTGPWPPYHFTSGSPKMT